ncbi:TPA: hypothetical protein ACH3X2_009922 [Trebouxia sp. C0005]|nr:MAG: tRNA-binding region domain-containing [Trebouxia sp. A1-2]
MLTPALDSEAENKWFSDHYPNHSNCSGVRLLPTACCSQDRTPNPFSFLLKAQKNRYKSYRGSSHSLYVEQVDVGEEAPRTIISGLVKYVPIEEMQGRPVMVLCNLKARNMRGIKSDGMLLCASNETHEIVEPLMPSKESVTGERVAYGDDETATQPEPETPNKVQKKKIWEAVQPHLKTNEQKQVVYKGTVMTTGAGPVTAPTLANANIS